MIVEYRKKFEKDLAKIKDLKFLQKVENVILDVETVAAITSKGQIPEINNLKRLTGFSDKYRLRLGD